MVAIFLHAARAARRPPGDFPDLLPARAAAVFLLAESGECGRVPSEPGAGAAHVSARRDGHQRDPPSGGEMKQLAAVQLVGNAAALLLGYYWLGIGEARVGLLAWSV